LAFGSNWRYSVADPNILGERPLAGGLGDWRTSGEGVKPALEEGRPVVRLSAAADRPIPVLARILSLPGRLDALRPSLEVMATDLVPAAEKSRGGRVQVWTFDGTGRFLWYWPKDVISLSGDQDWRTVGATIPLAEEVAAAYLVIYNAADSGDIAVRGIRVAGLEERAAFRIARILLLAAWIAAAAWGAAALLRAAPGGRLRYALLAAALATLAGILTPQPHFKILVAPIESAANALLAAETPHVAPPGTTGHPTVGQAAPDPTPYGPGGPPTGLDGAARAIGLKTAGHFAAFAMLTILAVLAFPGAAPVRTAAYLVLLAAASESLQRFLITRSSQGLDLAADVAGIILATGAVFLLRRLLRSRPAPR
jgi:hypothetical protein